MGKSHQVERTEKVQHMVNGSGKTPAFFLDECAMDYDALRSDFLNELKPRTPYQRSLAQDLVHFEWEIARLRRFRDAAVIARYRETALSVLERGDPMRRLGSLDKPTPENIDWVRDLISADPEVRRGAESEFEEETRFTCSELFATACARNTEVDTLEKRIADIETRRRRLREDYDRLKKCQGPEIEDAEVTGGSG
jgi:hypothetical protein